jgi:hypothetical protein
MSQTRFRPLLDTLPPHVRRGLLRVYFVVSIPWIMWFGYHFVDALNHRPRLAPRAFWSLLSVPIGSPIVFLLVVWVFAGFQKTTPRTEPPSAGIHAPPLEPVSETECYAVIGRAVSNLAVSTPKTRRDIYEHARAVFIAQLRGQDPPPPKWYFRRQRRTLEAAIHRFEREVAANHGQRKPDSVLEHLVDPSKPTLSNPLHRPSTALLVFSMFWPQYWLMDVTCMSLYWVARLPTDRSPWRGVSTLNLRKPSA